MAQHQIVDIDGEPIDHEFEVLLKPKEAAQLLSVNPTTLTKWANQGRIRSVRLVSGHRRYPASAVRAACNGDWHNAANKQPHSEMSPADVVVATND